MKHLIVGLGNIGYEYAGTRHNVGFRVLDALASGASNSVSPSGRNPREVVFRDGRFGATAEMRVKNQELLLLKPNTYMNLSGNAVRYWMQEAGIPLERVLVVVDDLALPVGALRMKPGGSAGGHNGLKHIAQVLGTEQYARLRMGIASNFGHGHQVDYVLGHFDAGEEKLIDEATLQACEMIKAYALSGIQFAMNHFNKRGAGKTEQADGSKN